MTAWGDLLTSGSPEPHHFTRVDSGSSRALWALLGGSACYRMTKVEFISSTAAPARLSPFVDSDHHCNQKYSGVIATESYGSPCNLVLSLQK